MFTNTKIALGVAIIICVAPVARANDIDQSASGAQVEREWKQWQASLAHGAGSMDAARAAYGYVAPHSGRDPSRSGKGNKTH